MLKHIIYSENFLFQKHEFQNKHSLVILFYQKKTTFCYELIFQMLYYKTSDDLNIMTQ